MGTVKKVKCPECDLLVGKAGLENHVGSLRCSVRKSMQEARDQGFILAGFSLKGNRKNLLLDLGLMKEVPYDVVPNWGRFGKQKIKSQFMVKRWAEWIVHNYFTTFGYEKIRKILINIRDRKDGLDVELLPEAEEILAHFIEHSIELNALETHPFP